MNKGKKQYKSKYNKTKPACHKVTVPVMGHLLNIKKINIFVFFDDL